MLVRAAALLLAAPALFGAAAAGAQTADTAMPAKKKIVDPDKKLCRTTDTTGSIMGGTRECHTKAEWSAIDQRNSDNVSSQRDRNGQGGNRQGGGFGG